MGVETRGLALGVDARVGAARARDLGRRPEDLPEGLLDSPLDAPLARLSLPAREVGPVVGEDEEEVASAHQGAARLGRVIMGKATPRGEACQTRPSPRLAVRGGPGARLAAEGARRANPPLVNSPSRRSSSRPA
jgi:hypothetical protein